MSGQCRHCGHDGCVCTTTNYNVVVQQQKIKNQPERTMKTDEQRVAIAKLLGWKSIRQDNNQPERTMNDKPYLTNKSRLKYNTLTKQNNEQTN